MFSSLQTQKKMGCLLPLKMPCPYFLFWPLSTHAKIELLLPLIHCDLHLHGSEVLLLGRNLILFCLVAEVLEQPCLL